MGRHTHHIKVKDDGANITVEPVEKPISVGDVVSWVLTSDSEPGSSIDITFTGASPFNATQYAENEKGGFGLITTSPGGFDYTVTSADGKRSTDPTIIVKPVDLPAPTQN
jgi:plastocyanin